MKSLYIVIQPFTGTELVLALVSFRSADCGQLVASRSFFLPPGFRTATQLEPESLFRVAFFCSTRPFRAVYLNRFPPQGWCTQFWRAVRRFYLSAARAPPKQPPTSVTSPSVSNYLVVWSDMTADRMHTAMWLCGGGSRQRWMLVARRSRYPRRSKNKNG